MLQNLQAISPVLALIVEGILAFLSCIGFSILFRLRSTVMIAASFGGVISWISWRLSIISGMSQMTAVFIAALLLSLWAEIMARLHARPATIYLIVALIPLVPGGGIYLTMRALIDGNSEQFVSQGTHTLITAGSLALGILTVSSIARLISRINYECKNKRSRT
ncbi:MAG: threonine/serine exporter [Clostridiaceae bacterium]|nr:threonine/serine exporter [Clostridiaceae bacterium]